MESKIKDIFSKPLIGSGSDGKSDRQRLEANGWTDFDVSEAARALVEKTRKDARGAGYRGGAYIPMTDEEWASMRAHSLVAQAYADARTVLMAVKREVKTENAEGEEPMLLSGNPITYIGFDNSELARVNRQRYARGLPPLSSGAASMAIANRRAVTDDGFDISAFLIGYTVGVPLVPNMSGVMGAAMSPSGNDQSSAHESPSPSYDSSGSSDSGGSSDGGGSSE